RKRPGRIVTRVWPYQDYPQMLPTDFLFGLDQNAPLSIIANRINHDIHVQRVEIREQTGVLKYQLNEDDRNALVEAVGLEWGMLVVFTRTDLNTLGLMAFHTCGKHTTMTDERMEHICLRPGHTEHFGERNDTFYKRFSSTLDKQRLTISARLMEKHPYMHLYRKALIRHQKNKFEMKMKMDRHLEKPSRTNHVNIRGKWRQFGKACGFEYNKMMRVKYMYAVQSLYAPKETAGDHGTINHYEVIANMWIDLIGYWDDSRFVVRETRLFITSMRSTTPPPDYLLDKYSSQKLDNSLWIRPHDLIRKWTLIPCGNLMSQMLCESCNPDNSVVDSVACALERASAIRWRNRLLTFYFNGTTGAVGTHSTGLKQMTS
ncbi:hypothetical protein Tco_0658396, partial [Tanacetum coccineum]